jgi:hypothetical protein
MTRSFTPKRLLTVLTAFVLVFASLFAAPASSAKADEEIVYLDVWLDEGHTIIIPPVVAVQGTPLLQALSQVEVQWFNRPECQAWCRPDNFMGWYYISGQPITPTDVVDANNPWPIVAHWVGEQYKVAFITHGDKWISYQGYDVREGSTLSGGPYTSKAGATFAGWVDARGEVLYPYTPITRDLVAKNDPRGIHPDTLVLYASWLRDADVSGLPYVDIETCVDGLDSIWFGAKSFYWSHEDAMIAGYCSQQPYDPAQLTIQVSAAIEGGASLGSVSWLPDWPYPPDANGNNLHEMQSSEDFELSQLGLNDPVGYEIAYVDAIREPGDTELTRGEVTWVKYPWGSGISIDDHGIVAAGGIPFQSDAPYKIRVYLKPLSQTAGTDPQGNLNNIETRSGGIWVRGWVADNDAPTTALQARVVIGDGAAAESFLLDANLWRSDIPRTYPQFGTDHGFNQTLTTSLRGEQKVYVYAVNAPGTGGADKLIATRTVTIGVDPQGNLNNIEARDGGQLWVRGWVADNDEPLTVLQVKVSIGGELGSGETHTLTAGLWRSDIPRTYPQFGTDHGFNQVLSTQKRGEQQVYVYAMNVAGGADKLIAIRTVTIPTEVIPWNPRQA